MPDKDTQKNPWLERVPNLEGGKRFPSIKPDDDPKLFDELLAGGKEAVVGIIDTLKEVDNGKDWKARFLLSALATQTGAPDKKEARSKVEAIFASELQADRPAGVKTFLAMQLGWFAGPTSVAALASQLAAEDVALVDAAAAALTAIGKPAAPALSKAKGMAGGHGKAAIEHALKQIG